MSKTFKTKRGKEITVKVEKNRYWVRHTEMSNQFVTVDVALDSWILTKEEKDFINNAIAEL